jgi:hypothetical protein
MELTRDTTIYSCNLENQARQLVTQANQWVKTQGGKPKNWRGDLFAEVRNHPLVIPTSPLRKLELPTKSQLQAGSLSITFPTPLALASFLAKAKRTFINFPMTHHNIGSSRAMPSHLGGFTSKSNKCHEDCFTKLKCSQGESHSILTWIYHKSHKSYKEV